MRRKAGWIITVLWMAIAGNAAALTGPELAGEFDRGLKAYDARQYPEAFQIWWNIKDQDLAAMRNVALMLRKGLGAPKDPRKAEDILKTAAATGMPNAKVDLAEMYLNGEVGQPAPKRALPLLQSAADSGHPLGQFLLGQMYEDGNAVPKDINKAAELYIASARGGLREAKERLAALGESRSGTPDSSAAQVASISPPPQLRQATLPPPVTTPTSAYVVQVGSFKSAETAEAQWNRLKQNPSLVSLPHQIEKADLGQKGIWYRLLVAGGNDRKPATALCDQLMASGQPCLVRHSPAGG